MNRSELKTITGQYGLHPNKRLGQNFLMSGPVRDRIIGALGLAATDQIMEIGPGLGALTGAMLETAAVTAVEIDSGLCRYLADRFSGHERFTLVHADFLKADMPDAYTKVASNLPYYCSSEILFRLAGYSAKEVFVMLQKEMADRIVAAPGSASYGALSVTLGFYYDTASLFRVPRESFYPRPEVTSSFLRFARKSELPLGGDDIGLFHVMVKSAFWGRRKTILTALSDSPHMDAGREAITAVLERAGISGGVRGERLGLDEYVALVRAYRSVAP